LQTEGKGGFIYPSDSSEASVKRIAGDFEREIPGKSQRRNLVFYLFYGTSPFSQIWLQTEGKRGFFNPPDSGEASVKRNAGEVGGEIPGRSQRLPLLRFVQSAKSGCIKSQDQKRVVKIEKF
jgi:hypothetical protein